MRIAALTLALCLPSAAALAGPWPRSEGGAFFALSRGAADLSFWAEYGLRETRWIAADLRRDADGSLTGALIFNQVLPLPGSPGERVVAAVHTRGEVSRDAFGFYDSALRIGVSLGMGLSTPVSGWVTAAAAYEHHPITPKVMSDWSLGLQLHPRIAALLQGEHDYSKNQPASHKIGATAILNLADKLRVTAGVWQSDTGFRELRLGSWFEF
ncbi:hypothetical protein [Falsigemmobacter faecalis]|uniref:Porin family protein n=1 Tax=Falsigemmobacter faecalis TaxID=2488730 RepID=A0A3P3DLL6_9RHOB|nr:hypothetical protein [Falsigemmobacter faecalis]RRH75140.1 hypothetical protein EG244_09145 [Falsigemmobacter faecalis]